MRVSFQITALKFLSYKIKINFISLSYKGFPSFFKFKESYPKIIKSKESRQLLLFSIIQSQTGHSYQRNRAKL